MYRAFYGLTAKPFTIRPDPAFLFMSDKHSTALAMLEYVLSGEANFVVITGEIGSGKTTLIRAFLTETDADTRVGVISNTHSAFGDLLQWVLAAFGCKTVAADKASRYQAFVEYLTETAIEGKHAILIIDEAQNLAIETLEELRLLSNVNVDDEQMLQMILVGQPELLQKLKQPELRQFAQRISVHYHLDPLTAAETKLYIEHRLHTAGARVAIFDELAIGAVHYFTDGVPRLINLVCDMALVYGFARGKKRIDVDTIVAVARDKERGLTGVLARSAVGFSRDAVGGGSPNGPRLEVARKPD